MSLLPFDAHAVASSRGWRGPLRRLGLAAVAGVLVSVAGPLSTPGGSPLEAQVPSLDRVDSLMARGDVPAARAALTAWWDARFADASPLDEQRGLWLRGKLTVDPGMARRDYLRLVLEHPGGPHSADALLRLAQLEHAAGRFLDAARHFEQLLRDYPDSPHRLEARRWLDENRDALVRARAESRDSETDAGPVRGSAPSPGAGGPVSVQIGAFSSEERALGLMGRMEEQGIEGARMVRVDGSRLIRVRVGYFPDRAAAESLRSRIEGLGFDAAIVTDGEQERPLP